MCPARLTLSSKMCAVSSLLNRSIHVPSFSTANLNEARSNTRGTLASLRDRVHAHARMRTRDGPETPRSVLGGGTIARAFSGGGGGTERDWRIGGTANKYFHARRISLGETRPRKLLRENLFRGRGNLCENREEIEIVVPRGTIFD